MLEAFDWWLKHTSLRSRFGGQPQLPCWSILLKREALLESQLPKCIIKLHCLIIWSHLEDIRFLGQPQQLAGLAQADAVHGGQIIAAREDAHVAKLFLCENVPQRATAAQVTLVYLQAIALLVHFEDHLDDCGKTIDLWVGGSVWAVVQEAIS